ncbi:MAG: hypothetical protein M1840_003089 [Geoglossum simile]|nr:MAG: hypothetical protein M1840_003089 [Geoglossum simile]
MTPSHVSTPLAPEAQYYSATREPSVLTKQLSELLVSPEPIVSPLQVVSKISISPEMGDLLARFSQATMELVDTDREESQSNTVARNVEMVEQRRSFIDVNARASEVLEDTRLSQATMELGDTKYGRESQSNTVAGNVEMVEQRRSFIDVNARAPEVLEDTRLSQTMMELGDTEYGSMEGQNNTVAVEMVEQHRSFIDINFTASEAPEDATESSQSPSDITMTFEDLDDNLPSDTENHVILRRSTNIVGAEALQGRRSFLKPEPNFPVPAAGTESGRSSESWSPPATIVSQPLRPLLLPGLLHSPVSQGCQPFRSWNSRDRQSFLNPRPLDSLPLAYRGKRQLQETQGVPSGTSQGRRSFLTLDLSPATTPQGRRSVITPHRPTRSIPQGRRLFISPISPVVGNSQDRQLSLMPESQLPGQALSMATPSSHRFEFIEYNGMWKILKSTQDMDKYLQQRRGWIGMIIRQRVAKTIRFDHIVKHMINNSPSPDETYALVKAAYAEQFRKNLAKVTRSAGTNENNLHFTNSSINKRPKN